MNFKKKLSASLSPFFWLAPFLCFMGGYFALDLFLSHSHLTTPAVIGLSLSDALSTLSKKNLNARLLATKEDPHLPEGTIVSQNPSPGSTIRSQQAVFLVTSGKPAPTRTPAYVSQSYAVLSKQLTQEAIAHQAFFVPSNHPQGTCIAQIPEEGEPVTSSPLILYVSQTLSCPFVILPSFEKRSVEEVTTFLTSHALPFYVFHDHPLDPHHDCSDCMIIEQKPRAGTSISSANPPTIQIRVNG